MEVQILTQINVVWEDTHWHQEGRGAVECQAQVISAILGFADIGDVIGNVHCLHPGVLEHLAVDVEVKVIFPLDEVTRSRHFYHVGVGDRFIVALFDTLDEYKIIARSQVHSVYHEPLYVPGPSISKEKHVTLKPPILDGTDLLSLSYTLFSRASLQNRYRDCPNPGTGK